MQGEGDASEVVGEGLAARLHGGQGRWGRSGREGGRGRGPGRRCGCRDAGGRGRIMRGRRGGCGRA